MPKTINIIGAGLAGSEAAWQIAKRGINVNLYEMRPGVQTPAHRTGLFGELVCSNSLRANSLSNAVGLLKEELRMLDSLIMEAAEHCQLPAGGALAVDRELFAAYITEKVTNHPLIKVFNEGVVAIDHSIPLIIAAGPLCSDQLAEALGQLLNQEYLYFFDAAAPIVLKESIDFTTAFWGSRYEKGGKDYINCPMTKAEYDVFWHELTHAEVQPLHEFEDKKYFEGCMPVEVMAGRGEKTLLFGPLKPVGLVDHRGEQPYAVVQLRQDNEIGTLYNMVGFQTRLKWPEQQRVFGLIPALHNAKYARFGVMHRNTFVNAPAVMKPTGQLKEYPHIFIAGQLSGVEGYVESTASGMICGINASRMLFGDDPLVFPSDTAHGALMNYITTTSKNNFQPMNITFGLFPPLKQRIKSKKDRKQAVSEHALATLKQYAEETQLKTLDEGCKNV